MKESIKVLIVFFAIFILASPVFSAPIRGGAVTHYTDDPNTVTYEMKKGWNLVPALPPATDVKYDNTCNDTFTNTLSGNKNFPYMWIYVPTVNSWTGIDSKGNQIASGTYQNPYQRWQDDYSVPFYYAVFGNYFVYSIKDCEISLDLTHYAVSTVESVAQQVDELMAKSKLQFAKGYNFVMIHPQFEGKKMKDVFGDCNVDKFYGWEPYNQVWSPNGVPSVPVESIFDTEQGRTWEFPANSAGNIMLMHFKQQCTLQLLPKEPVVPNVPQLPG